MKPMSINFADNTIVMTREFAKKASDTKSKEFRELQKAMMTFPTFEVVQHTIKKNPHKETFPGLNYQFMRDYIISHVELSKRKQAIDDLEEQIFLSRAHSGKFPIVRKWFLATYPEVRENYGKIRSEEVDRKEVEAFYADYEDDVA